MLEFAPLARCREVAILAHGAFVSSWTPLSSARDSRCWTEAPDRDPTTSPAFFDALEASGSAARTAGWQPLHLESADAGVVVPLYAKSHSYGEYVFDHGWANAAQRAGMRYYPKLLTAVPFTPSQGRRLIGPGAVADPMRAASQALAAAQALAERSGTSSWHVLFPNEAELEAWQATGMLHRLGCQYHWFDRGYGDFEGFLANFRASRRKTLRRERRAVAEQGIRVETLEGAGIEPRHWEMLDQCYRLTYLKRSGHEGYLTPTFFRRLAESLSDRVVLMLAWHEDRAVAAALCLRSDDTLYGRYWGALGDYPQLHFELCYYQGIEYCLRNGLRRFDPGAQGEHKIPRGFEPVLTHSFHWLAEPALAKAVDDFLQQERRHVRAYTKEARLDLPFHRDGSAPV
ncbi:MAG: GNAT family N-acetyltransferase [Pigmentiphaga sp.]